MAINTSLISDTDSTDDLGSTSKQWANLYVDRVVCETVTDLIIENNGLDKDIIFKINDGGVDTEVMRIDGDVGNVGFGVGSTAGRDVIQLHVADIGSSGTRDSHAILWAGKANDGSEHVVNWQAYADVTSNAGASTFLLRNRVDAAAFATKLSITDGGLLKVIGSVLVDDGANTSTISGGIGGEGIIKFRDSSYGHMVFDNPYGYRFECSTIEYMRLTNGGNLGLGTSTFDGTGTKTFNLTNATAPVAHVDNQVILYSVDTADSTATLGLWTEQAVESVGTFTATHKLKILVNGTAYWIQLDAV